MCKEDTQTDRHVEKLSTTIDEYRSVLAKLFPNHSPQSLVNLSREKLLEIVASTHPLPPGNARHPVSLATSAEVEAYVPPLSAEDENLESLQSMPEELSDSRSSSSVDLGVGVSDDFNALSLAARQPSSYLGVSSVHSFLKVIIWLDPGSASYLARTPARTPAPNHEYTVWQLRAPVTPPQPHIPPTEIQMLDAYFLYFQHLHL